MYNHKNGIVLRKLEKEDLFLLKELKNESWFGTHNITFVNEQDQEKWFNSLDSNKNLILIAIKSDTKEIIGLYKIFNIDWINRKYDSAHDIFKQHRGKGYSKPLIEAGIDFGFEILNMNRIDTEVLVTNQASLKSALWVGFIKEGIKRKCIHKCNHYIDSIVLGILKEEWVCLDRVKKYEGVCNLNFKLT